MDQGGEEEEDIKDTRAHTTTTTHTKDIEDINIDTKNTETISDTIDRVEEGATASVVVEGRQRHPEEQSGFLPVELFRLNV